MNEKYCSNTKKKKKAIWLSLHELQKKKFWSNCSNVCIVYTFSIVGFFSFKSGVDDQENQTEHLYFANKGIGSLIQ